MLSLRYWIVRLRGWIEGIPFNRSLQDPKSSQLKLLQGILRENAETAFGKAHGFRQISDVESYQKSVPIRDHQGHKSYIDQILQGQFKALTHDPPFMFASTSGTTSQPKWLPINNRWYQQMSRIVRIWLHRASKAHPRIFKGRVLTIVSPAVEEISEIGIPVGSVSGLTSSRVPWILRRTYAVPYKVAEIEDYALRYFVIARMACEHSVSLLLTPNPSTLQRIADEIQNHAPQIISAIREGRLGIDMTQGSEAQQSLYKDLEKDCSANPRRAQYLQNVLDQNGVLHPKDCWPDLCLIGCWLGGSAGIHARQLRSMYGEVILRDLGLRATEGTFSVTLQDDTPDSVLTINANFYEFISIDEIDAESPHIRLAHELELGGQYYIIITTVGGLYRYDMNDIIEVTGFEARTPIIRFLRKGRDMISIVGEKLHVNQALAAASFATEQSGLKWVQFQLIPDSEASQHQFLVEWQDSAVSAERAADFMQHFDARLMIENPEYPTKRKSNRLQFPKYIRMRSGWAEGLRDHEFQAGKREAQYKWRYMCNEWDAYSRTCLYEKHTINED